MLISEVIQAICDFHEPYDEPPKTRDRYLAGAERAGAECTGALVTVCATMEVLREAVSSGANLVIAHESAFYGLPAEALTANDAAAEKLSFLDEHGLVVWRYHDHMHGKPVDPARTRPDYIFYGICQELDWQGYVVDDPLKPTLYEIPPTSVGELAQTIIRVFGLSGLRVVGAAEGSVTRVCMAEHAMGDFLDHSMERCLDAEVFIPFEICDYTLTQYVRDAAQQGRQKTILEMGHFNCEELGMRYAARYLAELLEGAVEVRFVQSGDVFGYLA